MKVTDAQRSSMAEYSTFEEWALRHLCGAHDDKFEAAFNEVNKGRRRRRPEPEPEEGE